MTDNEKAATFIGWEEGQEETNDSIITPEKQAELKAKFNIYLPADAPDMVDPRNWAKALGYALTLDDWVELHPNIYEALVHRDWLAIVKMLAALYDAEHPA